MDPTISDATPDKAAQIAMTLAEIAYAQPGDIQTLLDLKDLATEGRWQKLWNAADDANQAYIAEDRVTGQIAVAIRGTVTDPFSEAFWLDWFVQDLEAFEMDDWPFGGAPAGAKIAPGTLEGMQSLIGLRDAGGVSMVEFLRTHSSPARMWSAVVGHSLGGALASVMAPYLSMELASGGTTPFFWGVTFAAPTAGNSQLAGWLTDNYLASVGRYWNSLDVVPHSWADLAWIAGSFPDGGPQIPDVVWGLVKGVQDILDDLDDHYVQPGGDGMVLQGTIAQGDDWYYEAGHQHSGETYLQLLGAPPVPFPNGE